MICWACVWDTVVVVKLSVPVPSAITTGAAADRPETPKNTPPVAPAAPGWMWAAIAGVPAGNPESWTEKLAVPPPELVEVLRLVPRTEGYAVLPSRMR